MEKEFDYPKAYRYRRIVQAKRYIDKNFDQSIDLDDVSDEANFSKYHFLRLFKSAYGKTPNRYLTERRLKGARALLGKNKLSISAICFEVGFESIGSFSSLFKKKLGESPSEYRARAQQKKQQVKSKPTSVIPNCFEQAFF